MIIREILYRLLSSKHGEAVKQLGIVGSQTQRIAKVIDSIKMGFAKTLSMENLAKDAGMSPASFHKYFKDITSMSPPSVPETIAPSRGPPLTHDGQS